MPTFGPPSTNMFGNPLTVVQRCARGLPSQCSERLRPSRPWIRLIPGKSVTWKPVPRMIASTSRSVPLEPTTVLPRTSARPSACSSTLGSLERRVEVVGDQHPLAAERVVGGELAPQLRVGDLPPQVRLGAALEQLHQPRALDEAEHERLAAPVLERRGRAAGGRGSGAAAGARAGRSGGRVRGAIQAGVRWKRWSSPTSGWICGTNWIAEAPVPITATRLPRRS